MRRAIRPTAFILVVLGLASSAGAYGIDTHRRMSDAAFRPVASTLDFLTEIGLTLEHVLMGSSVTDWVTEGAIREDDGTRALNHFYDPVSERQLTILAVPLGESSSPNWALEDRGEILSQGIPVQHFSYRDARQYIYEGLTLPDPKAREKGLALAFRTLGQVIHHIQDMAAPQHVRNDAHPPFSRPSKFENLIESLLPQFTLTGYPAPRLGGRREYWKSTDGTGRGIAELVNRNFISTGTNFTDFAPDATPKGYDAPRLDLNLCRTEILEPTGRFSKLLPGKVIFCGNQFFDPHADVFETNPRMTTFSIFDDDLVAVHRERTFSYNRFNIESAARLLLPRAVGYSAGLITYFFRGRLDPGLLEGEGPEERVLQVVNRSPESLGAGGTLTLYADDGQGNRVPVPGATITLAEAVPPDNDGQDGRPAPLQMRFTAPPSAARYTLVYRGPLGSEEDAVIGKVFGGGVLEQIYRDSQRGLWVLRTPTGLFALPLDTFLPPDEGVEDVLWGGADNVIIGFFPSPFFGSRKIYQFQINRAPGSADVPVTGEQTGDLPTVALTLRQTIDLTQIPTLSTGATVEAQGSLNFQQYLTTIEEDHFFEWGDSGLYDLRTIERRIAVSRVQDLSDAVSATHPLLLDAGHGPGAARPPFYRWGLLDAASTPSGEVLGLLEVSLEGDFPNSSQAIPLIVHDGTGALIPASQLDPPIPEFVLNVSFAPPSPGPLLAVVNLTRNTLLASTFKPAITQQGQHHQDHVTLAGLHLRLHFTGGPDPGDREEWLRTSLSPWTDLELPTSTTTISTISGSEQTLKVWPEELIPLGIPGGAATVQRREQLYSAASRSRTEGILHQQEIRGMSPPDFRLAVSLLCDPGVAAEAAPRVPLMALFSRSHTFPDEVKILRWDPAGQIAHQALHDFGFVELRACDRGWALLLDTWQRRSWLIPMDGNGELIVLPTLLSDHVLLPGSLLYEAREQRFYRVGPSLTPLAGGPPLAPAPDLANRPWWPYHLAGR